MNPRFSILFLSISYFFAGFGYAEEISYIDKESPHAAQLQIKILDDQNEILPACLSLTDTKGDSLWGLDEAGKPMLYGGQPRIWISGDVLLDVTAETYRYLVSRPYDYRVASGTLTLTAEQKKTLDVKLERLVDLPQSGWYGGDAHQHVMHGEKDYAVNLKTAIRIARAEGGDWSSFNSYWSSIPKEIPTLDELRTIAEHLSDRYFLAFVGDEYPKDHLGHMAFLAGPILDWNREIGKNEYSYPEGQREDFAHFEILKPVFDRGGLSIYSHPVREYGGTPQSPANIARELPFDILAAPDLVPTVDWMTDNPDDRNAMNLWTMYLNWGYKIGLCAFTDTCYDRKGSRPFDRRTFVFLGNQSPNATNIIDGLRRGRTYGTTGPLLRLDLNGFPPGSAFPADSQPAALSVDAFAPGMDYLRREDLPVLDRIELIRNGNVVDTISLKDQKLYKYHLSRELREKENAWYIVKVFASGERQVAISSPFYFRKDYTNPEAFSTPKPVLAHVCGTVADAKTGERIPAKIELFFYGKGENSIQKTMASPDGAFEFDCLPTLRLRAQADGYQAQIKSLFFDSPQIYRDLILPLQRARQLDPLYYDRIKSALSNIKIDFILDRERSFDP